MKLRGDTNATVHEVHKVNKLTNRVILKREVNKAVRVYSYFYMEYFHERRLIGLRPGRQAKWVVRTIFTMPAPRREVRVSSSGGLGRTYVEKVRLPTLSRRASSSPV